MSQWCSHLAVNPTQWYYRAHSVKNTLSLPPTTINIVHQHQTPATPNLLLQYYTAAVFKTHMHTYTTVVAQVAREIRLVLLSLQYGTLSLLIIADRIIHTHARACFVNKTTHLFFPPVHVDPLLLPKYKLVCVWGQHPSSRDKYTGPKQQIGICVIHPTTAAWPERQETDRYACILLYPSSHKQNKTKSRARPTTWDVMRSC